MSSPGNEAETPEQKGKKCCNKVNQISQTVNNLLIQITRLLSTRAAGIQTRTNEIMEPCCKQLKEKVDYLQERMDKVQRSVQDQLINAYAMANAKAQELMRSPQPRTQEEEQSEKETKSEQETPNRMGKGNEEESIQTAKQPATAESIRETPKTPTSVKQPESPQPETPKTKGKRSAECLEIDWCEPFYIWLEQWQKQNIEQQQRSQESYRQCCEDANPSSKPEDEDFPSVKAPMDYYYEEIKEKDV